MWNPCGARRAFSIGRTCPIRSAIMRACRYSICRQIRLPLQCRHSTCFRVLLAPRLAGMDRDRRARLAEADQLNRTFEVLYGAGKYAEAMPPARQALAIRKE